MPDKKLIVGKKDPKKLLVGICVPAEDATCDYCAKSTICARGTQDAIKYDLPPTFPAYNSDDANLEWVGFLGSSLRRVLKEKAELFFVLDAKKIKKIEYKLGVHICKSCAKQISEQL